MTALEPTATTRDRAIDHARGVASLIMIQGHAFHAWVSPAHKHDFDYLFTRVFATLPLPAFLVLSGAAVAYRAQNAARKEESSASLRHSLVRRGLQVTLIGYLVNVAYALIDGVDSLETLLRADVLQVIGLSIASLGLCAGGQPTTAQPKRLALRAIAVGTLVTLLCAPLTQWSQAQGATLPWPLRVPLAAWVAIPELTRMPYVPLFAWSAIGHLAGYWLAVTPPSARTRRLWQLSAAALGLSVFSHYATSWALAGQPLSRSHYAVVFNVLEYAGRGLLVLGLGPLMVARLPQRVANMFSYMGRASLWAYVFHIPFCYGRLGQSLYAHHSVISALPYVLLLIASSYLVVRVRLAWPQLRTSMRTGLMAFGNATRE